EYLKLAILDALKAGRQIILFLNRRGSSTVVMCKDCAFVPTCKDCAVSLVWHSKSRNVEMSQGFLLCHHCGKKYDMPSVCPSCASTEFSFWGVGTQLLEDSLVQFLKENFARDKLPEVARMDQDSMEKTGEHERIYKEWSGGKIKILIGTQIVSKGWDAHNVGLVGIISADTILHLPDFRSNERTFQVLTQVAGRAGRGTSSGLVILQTYHPDNYAIENARTHNFEKFYQKEIEQRGKYNYPPFCTLVKLTSAHANEQKAEEQIRSAFRHIAAKRNMLVEILGPVPAFISRVRKKYRYHLYLKIPKGQDVGIFELLKDLPSYIDIDVDPESLL
ncbi:MAG: primosomal protein N', partial [bacterium]|nr:primosomal protein N' [bacterium]